MSRIFRLSFGDKLDSSSIEHIIQKDYYYNSTGTKCYLPYSTVNLTEFMFNLIEPTLEWKGAYYMSGTSSAPHSLTLSKHISEYHLGIFIALSYYNSGGKDDNFKYYFIPKFHNPTGSITLFSGGTEGLANFKFIYFEEVTVNGKTVTKLKGWPDNSTNPKSGQLGNYKNNQCVFRAIYGI